MDLQQLIAQHWTGTASELADAINSQLDQPVAKWTVTRWVNGTQPGPRRPEVMGAIADALGVKLDAVRQARGVPQSNDTQLRLDRIESALKAHGILTADGKVAPTTAALRGRRSDVPVGHVEAVEDDTDATASGQV